jgi:hypothetical protein
MLLLPHHLNEAAPGESSRSFFEEEAISIGQVCDVLIVGVGEHRAINSLSFPRNSPNMSNVVVLSWRKYRKLRCSSIGRNQNGMLIRIGFMVEI